MKKEHLGDRVYVEFDSYGLILTTENALGPTNTISLEPQVYDKLVRYVMDLRDEQKKEAV